MNPLFKKCIFWDVCSNMRISPYIIFQMFYVSFKENLKRVIEFLSKKISQKENFEESEIYHWENKN